MNRSGLVIAGLCLIIGVLIGHTWSFSNPFARGSSVQVCTATNYNNSSDGTCPSGIPDITSGELKSAHMVIVPPTGGVTGADAVYHIFSGKDGKQVASGNLSLAGAGSDPFYFTGVLNNTTFEASYTKGVTYDLYVYYGTLMAGDQKLIGHAQFYYGG